MRPHISTVITDEDGNVADNANAAPVAGRAQCVPLLGKEELDNFFDYQSFLRLNPNSLQRSGVALRKFSRPGAPLLSIKVAAQEPKTHEVIEPFAVLIAKVVKALALFGTGATKKIEGRLLNDGHLCGTHPLKINRARG